MTRFAEAAGAIIDTGTAPNASRSATVSPSGARRRAPRRGCVRRPREGRARPHHDARPRALRAAARGGSGSGAAGTARAQARGRSRRRCRLCRDRRALSRARRPSRVGGRRRDCLPAQIGRLRRRAGRRRRRGHRRLGGRSDRATHVRAGPGRACRSSVRTVPQGVDRGARRKRADDRPSPLRGSGVDVPSARSRAHGITVHRIRRRRRHRTDPGPGSACGRR